MLADRVATAISRGFQIARPPTILAKLGSRSSIAFSHFRNSSPKQGLSVPSKREEAFVLNVPLIAARYSVVSVDGLQQSVVQSPGEAYLFDLTRRNEVSLDATYDSVRVHLPQTTLDELAYENGLRRVGGLHARSLGQQDEVLYRLALAILPAIVNSQQVTTAYVDYLACALHEHVIYTYAGSPVRRRPSGGLAPWQIRRACDFIEAHLLDDPSITELSQECGVSPGYFARAFRAAIGMTPHQWIIRRRIARAKDGMLSSTDSLAEVALNCGFVDQSHFGRCFAKLEGTSPGHWRRQQSARG